MDPLRTPGPVLALTAMAWGLVTLFFIRPRTANYDQIPREAGYRHLIIAWDVSPSMQLDDGGFDMGKQNKRTRAQRGAKVLLSLFERIALDQVRISIVAFFTKPVVVDTRLNVVKNILDDLPLDRAFDPGKTSVISGIEESVKLAKGWEPAAPRCWSSVTATRCRTRLPDLPPSINKVLVAGVGDPRRGVFIDGHMSRQEFPSAAAVGPAAGAASMSMSTTYRFPPRNWPSWPGYATSSTPARKAAARSPSPAWPPARGCWHYCPPALLFLGARGRVIEAAVRIWTQNKVLS